MTRERLIEIGGFLVILAGFISLAGWFAAQQSIWVDETTQLSGLALPFEEQLQWLTGRWSGTLGVPPDRMPPLSYWLGSLWASVFGLSENSMRWMGIAVVALAAPALHLAGRQVSGVLGGLFVTGILLLSATVVGTASAIRAYPIFLTLMAWAALFYTRLVWEGETLGRLVGLSILLLAATYTHFFGLVASGCVFLALIFTRFLEGKSVLRTVFAAFVTLLGSAGLLPFVLAAAGISPGAADKGGIDFFGLAIDSAGLAYRVIAHPAQLGISLLTQVHILATLTLTVLSIFVVTRSKQGLKLIALALPVFIGFVLLFIAGMMVNSFFIYAPHYNIWMLPFVSLALAGALADDGSTMARSARSVAAVAGIVLIATGLAGSVLMVRNAALYSNGAGDWVSARIPDWKTTLVMHSKDGPWGSLYFALFYNSGGVLEQWLVSEDGAVSRILPNGLEPVPDPRSARTQFQAVLTAESFQMSSADLAQIVRGERPCGAPIADQDFGKTSEVFCAYLGVRLSRLD